MSQENERIYLGKTMNITEWQAKAIPRKKFVEKMARANCAVAENCKRPCPMEDCGTWQFYTPEAQEAVADLLGEKDEH